MSNEDMAQRIKNIYQAQREAGEPMMITAVAEHLDATPAQLAEGMIHLSRTDAGFNLFPESCQRLLTPMDHAYAVQHGGQAKHVISWDA